MILEAVQVIEIHLDQLNILPGSIMSHLILEGFQSSVFVEGDGHLMDC